MLETPDAATLSALGNTRILKRILSALAILLIVGQFIRPARTAEPVDPTADLIAETKPPADVEHLLRVGCYDCHSGQPRYPWYTNISPVNWWLQHHIDEGREHFDVSRWGSVPSDKRAHWAEEAIEMVKEGEMPLDSYTWTHADARLTQDQRAALTAFFQPYLTGEEEHHGAEEQH